MILSYVFIKYNRSLTDINFNLGGMHSLRYDPLTEILNIEINTHYIDNFFNVSNENSNASINLVSAVVGENGVGKTSFLDCLKESLVANGQPNFEGIIVFEDTTSKTLNIFKHSNIPIKNQNKLNSISDYSIVFSTYDTYMSLITLDTQEYFNPNNNLHKITNKLSLIFLSNIFDKREEIETHGLFNLSTNFLVRNDYKSKLENKQIIEGDDVFKEHRLKEIQRELDFILEFNTKYRSILNFCLPEYLSFKILPLNLILSQIRSKYFIDILNKLATIYSDKNIEQKSYFNYIYFYFLTSVSNIINEFHKYKLDDSLDLHNETKLIFDAELLNKPIEFIHNIIDQFINKIFKSTQAIEMITALKSSVNILERYFTNIQSESQNIFGFSLKNKDEEALFMDFYSHYRKTYIYDSYINFDWRDLSTGQKALLNIYSRLFSLTKQGEFGQSNKLNENVLILIDEGELYLHPTWQKQLLFQLLKVIPYIYQERLTGTSNKIQLILTSNSPLIISDIPSSNIVFLRRKVIPDGTIAIINDKLDDHKLTFAANIHNLLADSFFMEDGLIGDFASHKVNEIIELLLGDSDKIIENKKYLETIIIQIGEQVIKSKLLQMYQDRFSLDIFDLNERVKYLEKKLNINN